MAARPDMDDRLQAEAVNWHHALARDDADWDGFTLWLEADPAHRVAYDAVALTDRLVDEHRDALRVLTASTPVAPVVGTGRTRRWFAIGSIAASIAAVVTLSVMTPAKGDAVYATSRGETRRIALDNGTAIDLGPASRLVIKAGDANDLELARGEALFAVDHDPGRMLTIRANGYAVRDIGTRFAMNIAGTALLVGVSEGSLSIGRVGAAAVTTLSAGQQIVARGDGAPLLVSAISPDSVGAWRGGRLVYKDAPLTVVAADISRYSGRMIVVDPSVGQRRFSGVLVVGDGSKLLDNLARFMAIPYAVEGDHLRLGGTPAR